MRRLLLGSILFSWIVFLASVTVGGFGPSGTGLLQSMQDVLMENPVFSLEFGVARAVLTGMVMATLAVALWAMMIAVTSDEEERRDRLVSVGGGFAVVLAISSVTMLFAAIAGAGAVVAMLVAVNAVTILSMLAAGGIEYALPVREALAEDGLAARVSRHLAASGARLAVIGRDRADDAERG